MLIANGDSPLAGIVRVGVLGIGGPEFYPHCLHDILSDHDAPKSVASKFKMNTPQKDQGVD